MSTPKMLSRRMRLRSAMVSRQFAGADLDRRGLAPLAHFSGSSFGVPVAVPVEEVLVGADQERAGAAGGVEDA